jgi:hypothetical protein
MQNLAIPQGVSVVTPARWASCYAVDQLANRSVAAVGDALAELMVATALCSERPQITVDQRLTALWFKYSFRPSGWEMPALWDPLAGDYPTQDGWIRLHTNLPHHRDAALHALGCEARPEAVRSAVAGWGSDALEQEVVKNGGVAAAMRSEAAWAAHPQGQAVAKEPLIAWQGPRHIALRPRPEATPARPLAGLRVLDLTRVLAGPVATRTLAGFGATVLRIDPPGWDEPGVLTDVALGKHMAALDLKSTDGKTTLERLLSEADVLVHGYRPGALDALGFTTETLRQIAPHLIDVRLNAYGWTGPWAKRRGFDSLVQMSSGIADRGRYWAAGATAPPSDARPNPLPVQALDHATGYLMAAAVLRALGSAARGDKVADAQLSLARTAQALKDLSNGSDDATGAVLTGAEDRDYCEETELTSWGAGQRLRSPLTVGAASLLWDHPAKASGSAKARWP